MNAYLSRSSCNPKDTEFLTALELSAATLKYILINNMASFLIASSLFVASHRLFPLMFSTCFLYTSISVELLTDRMNLLMKSLLEIDFALSY